MYWGDLDTERDCVTVRVNEIVLDVVLVMEIVFVEEKVPEADGVWLPVWVLVWLGVAVGVAVALGVTEGVGVPLGEGVLLHG